MNTPHWISFAKGHGSGNDFVILPDPHAELDLSPAQVVALCDRRTGIGGDGILRVVPAAKDPASVAQAGEAEWFMDYRNADGSLAQMCGNGTLVFARYLAAEGLAEPGILHIATCSGVKEVQVRSGSNPYTGPVTVELALPRLGEATSVIVNGVSLPAIAVDVGNPHAVCIVAAPLEKFDFSTAPQYDPTVFPEGVNVELITVPQPADSSSATPRSDLQVQMRVYERGSGETQSCGSGAAAAAAAALHAAQPDSVASLQVPLGTVWVDLPGGQLRIELTETAALLTGPVVIVAKGQCLL
jgi:diaminopimelate epimerase